MKFKITLTPSNYYQDAKKSKYLNPVIIESLEDFKKLQESRKTAEQIERDNIDKYKKSLEPKKEQLERSNKSI